MCLIRQCDRPQEILTLANAILGQGRLSLLAKYLWIVAREDQPALDIHDIPALFAHVLRRVDWRTDLHFQTQTTIDTLDYSGSGLNQGSKVVIAAAGPGAPCRASCPKGCGSPMVSKPAARHARHHGPAGAGVSSKPRSGEPFFQLVRAERPGTWNATRCGRGRRRPPLETSASFLWTTYTLNPAGFEGIGSFVEKKHWGSGSLVINARVDRGIATLVDDPAIEHRVDELAAPVGRFADLFLTRCLHGSSNVGARRKRYGDGTYRAKASNGCVWRGVLSVPVSSRAPRRRILHRPCDQTPLSCLTPLC